MGYTEIKNSPLEMLAEEIVVYGNGSSTLQVNQYPFQQDLRLIEAMKRRIPCKEDGIEFTCSKNGLARHIVRVHFEPLEMMRNGIARYDIELAFYRGVDLNWVVEEAYKKLERENEVIQREIEQKIPGAGIIPGHDFSIDDYKTIIIKNLQLIAKLGLGSVNVNRLKTIFPGVYGIEVDIVNGTRDEHFLK